MERKCGKDWLVVEIMSFVYFMCKFFYFNLLIVFICVELLMEIRLLINIKFVNEMNKKFFLYFVGD